MRAPTNLHIMAIAAGLFDEDVVALWSQAREATIAELGSDSHAQYREKTEARMLQAIENLARSNVQSDMVPWMLFDIHVAMALVKAREGISTAAHHVHDYLAGKLGKDRHVA